MARPKVGSIEFITMVGEQVEDPQKEFEDITRAEINGHAFRNKAKRGRKVTLFCNRDTVNPTTMEASILGLIGTYVDVIFPSGITRQQVFIHHGTAIQEVNKIVTPVGGIESSSAWMFKVRFVVQPTKVS